jgi:hypothetical protein
MADNLEKQNNVCAMKHATQTHQKPSPIWQSLSKLMGVYAASTTTLQPPPFSNLANTNLSSTTLIAAFGKLSSAPIPNIVRKNK